MRLSLDVPADIVRKLEAGWSDLPGHALEALAVQAYRSGLLTVVDVQRMVGLMTWQEADELLQQRAGTRPGLSDRAPLGSQKVA